jgi:putative flippase GtrA
MNRAVGAQNKGNANHVGWRALGILRAAAFAVSSAAGFIAAEVIIVLGLYVVFGKLEIPGDMSSSPSLLVLDVFVLAMGATVSFVLNERTTVRDVRTRVRESGGRFTRLARSEGVSALGSAVVIAVQLALLAGFGLGPAIRSVAGAVVGFPISYFMSMRLVWKVPLLQ